MDLAQLRLTRRLGSASPRAARSAPAPRTSTVESSGPLGAQAEAFTASPPPLRRRRQLGGLGSPSSPNFRPLPAASSLTGAQLSSAVVVRRCGLVGLRQEYCQKGAGTHRPFSES